MKRAGIAIMLLIAVIAVTSVCCVLDEDGTAPLRHHRSVHRATLRVAAKHQLDVPLADLVCGQAPGRVAFGLPDSHGRLFTHQTCELVTPLRI